MTISALIFDMDGVVVDSNTVHRTAWIEFNGRHGIETTEEMVGSTYGKRTDEIVRGFFGADLTDQEAFALGAAKEALYRELIQPNLVKTLVPGIREFLEAHKTFPIAMATNAEPANAAFVLDQAGLRPYFRFVIDGQQVTHPKPHPEIYLRAAALLGAFPGECVVFEDSYAGVAAGVAAGMPVIGIQTTHPELPGAALTVPDFHSVSLKEWLGRRLAANSVC